MNTTSQNAGDVGAAGGRRPEQAADLGHPARQPHLVVEDAAGAPAAGEQLDLVGDAGPGRVDQPEDRQLVAQGVLGEAHDLLDRARAPRPGLHRRVVGHHAHRAAVDRPTPVTTPSAGRSSARGVGQQAVLDERALVEQQGEPVAHEQLVLLGQLLAALGQVALAGRSWRARLACRPTFIGRMPVAQVLPDGQDGHVVGERRVGEVAGRLQQRLAQDADVLAGVAAQEAGDALLAEELLAGAGLGQTVGVEQQQVAGLELDLAAGVGALGVEREQRAGRPQRPHLAVVPQPRRRVAGRREAQGAGRPGRTPPRTATPGPRAGPGPTARC